MKIFSLKDQVAFVTGAGSGIGQAIATGLAEAGADVALFDLPYQSNGLDHTLAEIGKIGRKGLILEGSVTDGDALNEAVARTVRELGDLKVAVNAAGIANASPAESMHLADWQKMLDVDLTGVFLSCQAQGRAMIGTGGGSIINIASMSGSIVNRGLTQVHYNTAKAGVIHLSKSLAMEWVDRGIRVNSISPGYTLSPMNKRPEVAERLKTFAAETPMARIAAVDEMIGPAVFLASAASSFVTGHDLLVDGGFTAW